MEDFLSMFGGGGTDTMDSSGPMVSPYPQSSDPTGGQVSPYPQNSIDPGMQSYLQMLGMTSPSATPQVQPMTMAQPQMPVASSAGALPSGSLNPLLGLGITGQKSQQMPGIAALDAASTPNYTVPQPANPTGKGTGTASVPITAFL